MNAGEVRKALRGRWPDGEYLRIDEAPQDAARQGRKLDVLVLSLWRSRGFELDGVEIKVSVGDWRSELKNPAKADWWWEHVHRFWLAAPTEIAERIRPDLPPTWGLLGVSTAKVVEVVKAPKHEAVRLPWASLIGILRAADGGGLAALGRAETRGRNEGYAAARREAERTSVDAHVRAELDELKRRVAAFGETSGIDIAKTWSQDDAEGLGRLTALLREWIRNPSRAGDEIRRLADQAAGLGERLDILANELERSSRVQAVSG